MEVRAARKEDCAALAVLLHELAEQQGTSRMLALKDDALARDGFGKERFFQCFIAEVEQSTREIVGSALYCNRYSSWDGLMMFFLSIYVKPCSNREQIYEALIRRCAEAAVSTHCTRLQGEIKRKDTAAISWYNKLGAVIFHDWVAVWFSKPALTALLPAKENLETEVKSKFLIRPAQKSDVQSILYLIQILAEFEGDPHGLSINEKELLRDGFREHPLYYCIVAFTSSPLNDPAQPTQHGEKSLPSDSMPHDKNIAGFVMYMLTYYVPEGVGRVLQLEDIFVLPQYRDQGLGTILIRECAKVALDKGCARMQVNVPEVNTRALDLYKRIGGECHTEIVTARFSGAALKALGTGAQEK